MLDEKLLEWLRSAACDAVYDKNKSITVAQIITGAYGETPTDDVVNKYKRILGETMRYAGYQMRQLGTGDERIRAYVKVVGKKNVLGYFMSIVQQGRSGQYQAQGRIYHNNLEKLRAAAKVLVEPGYRINIYSNDIQKKDRYVPIEVIG